MALPNPNPSPPRRPPVEHLYFTVFDPESNQVRFFTRSFGAHYAAAYWLHRLIDSPAKHRWITPNHLEFERNGWRLIVKGSHLEDNIERKLTKEEKQWTPAYPDNIALEHLIDFHIPTSSPSTTTTTTTPKPTPTPKPKKTKAPTDPNTITVAQIAQEFHIPGNKARQILRKAGFTKPPHGWTYQKTDPLITKIRDLFSKS